MRLSNASGVGMRRSTSAAGMPSGGRHCRSTSCSSRTSRPSGSCSKFFLRSAGGWHSRSQHLWKAALWQQWQSVCDTGCHPRTHTHTHTHTIQSSKNHFFPLTWHPHADCQSHCTNHYHGGQWWSVTAKTFTYTLKLTLMKSKELEAFALLLSHFSVSRSLT